MPVLQHVHPHLLQIQSYVFTFVMHGSLNVLRVWIQNGFETPTNEMAELIYTLCNNIAR
ncbi:TetR-like C-terminal domain-containing protein [Butyrivibrio sp. AC2005]|uniref:TetR-like C-terminal domain-containing protein n=1 Tax=Butyrivibrio sp. AC2005 TaxID=1280672 RepID=UPI003FA4AB3A